MAIATRQKDRIVCEDKFETTEEVGHFEDCAYVPFANQVCVCICESWGQLNGVDRCRCRNTRLGCGLLLRFELSFCLGYVFLSQGFCSISEYLQSFFFSQPIDFCLSFSIRSLCQYLQSFFLSELLNPFLASLFISSYLVSLLLLQFPSCL